MHDVACRLAAPVDAPTLSALAIQVFLGTYAEDGIGPSVAHEAHELLSPTAFDAALADPTHTLVLAERDGRLLGFAQLAFPSRHALVPHENSAELVRLYVQERSTRRGIGRALLGQAEDEAVVRGASTLWLSVWAPNLRALAFYDRCGYASLGASIYRYRDDVYETRVFSKRLAAGSASWRSPSPAPSLAPPGVDAPVDIRIGYVPGCIGRIAALHASWYSANAGFGLTFESKVARELGEFCERCVDGRDGLWLATRGGAIEGSIAIDASHAAADGAHLRWFVVSDALRGRGVGNDLLGKAIAFCRECGYDRVHLWTFQGLNAAAHLYRKHGFRLALERPGTQWGREVVEQRYELEGF
jgi:GNAT superfamily N-acetyltransferase